VPGTSLVGSLFHALVMRKEKVCCHAFWEHRVSKKDMILLLFAVAAIAVAGVVFVNNQGPKENGEGLDRVDHYSCQNESCQAEFTMTLAELNDGQIHPETGMPACPTCGDYTVTRALPCPSCGTHLKLVGHGQLPKVCPSCGAQIVKPTGGDDNIEPLPADSPHAPG